MTKIIIKKQDNRIIGVTCMGHTGFAKSGEDIVCSAISSIVQTAALGILVEAGVNANITKIDEDGYFKLELPKTLNEMQDLKSQTILNTMLLGLYDIKEGYSNFIELEVK